MSATPLATISDRQHTDMAIEGMTCSACATRLEKALTRATGIDSAAVNFALERADVSFDPDQTDIAGIADVVTKAGFAVGRQSFSFPVSGMTCSACSNRVEKALHKVPGVIEANVNLALERADVQVIAGAATLTDIVDAVERAGYEAVVQSAADQQTDADEAHRAREQSRLRHELLMLLASSALTLPLVAQMFAHFGAGTFHLAPLLELALATPVQFVIGARFYRAAYKALAARSSNMDVLVVMGTSAAYFYSLYLLVSLGEGSQGKLYFEASAVIITLVLLGKFMESRAKRGTTAAIRQLMDLRPQTARVKNADGSETEMPIAEVHSGDTVVVRPGESIPVDGIVAAGFSELDESLITGESLPVAKTAGDSVTGGAINGTGLLEITATTVGQDSTLSKIIHLVENAQAGKAPVQRLVDRISGVFVPTVVGIATITFIAWYVIGGVFEPALIAAVSVLVIACPCALGLATPTAIMTGTGAAARSGILIKDIESLERAHGLSAIIFDKTGTLTLGKPSVVSTGDQHEPTDEMLRLAASVQQGSEHPLGRAILDAAEKRGLSLSQLGDFRSFTGMGVAGEVDGSRVYVGNEQLLAEHGLEADSNRDNARAWEAQGKTVVWVARDSTVLGAIAIADSLRPEAVDAVRSLRELNIRTLMISGDAELVAEEVGQQVGVDEARGAVKPDEKARIVEDLISEGHSVGMIGDGINDAPALAAADVGIAMGTGTDIAMETAGITLMRSDPRLVAAAISASRATFRKIKQNLFWAFFYNVVGIPLAAMGYLTPAVAGLAMAMSSVSVVSNSLLLRRWKPTFSKRN